MRIPGQILYNKIIIMLSKIKAVALVITLLLTVGMNTSAGDQIYWNNPFQNNPQRPGESAWDYGYRIAKESQEKAIFNKTKYLRSCTWPNKEDLKITRRKRVYLEQSILADKRTTALSATPGEGDEGIELMFEGNLLIAYAEIDKNGQYKNGYSPNPIGFLERGSAGIKYVTGDTETGDIIIYATPDHTQLAFIHDTDGLLSKKIYDTTKARSVTEHLYNPGINFNETQINVAQPNSKRSSSRRTCTSCNGSGKGMSSKYYAPDYTGESSDYYCKECNSWGSRHTHLQSSCKVCNGKGYID